MRCFVFIYANLDFCGDFVFKSEIQLKDLVGNFFFILSEQRNIVVFLYKQRIHKDTPLLPK